MADTINEIKKTKPVYSLITKGGMAASAAYGIISASTKIFAEEGMSIVGSIGTMISFEGYASNTKSADDVKHITVYASKSTMKNKAFEEALNNDNYDLLVSELLDPVNDNFIAKTLANRPQLKGTDFDNGHTVFSKDAIGTFIDGIASFNEVVEMVLNDSKTVLNINNNTNTKMTREEFKNTHPELFNEVYQEGIAAEHDRVATWEVYREADSKTVSEGIKSGKVILASQTAELQLKMLALNGVQALQADSAKPVQTAPAAIQEVVTDKNAKEVEEASDFKLK
ncbi:Peptidase family S49 [compost metagenome]